MTSNPETTRKLVYSILQFLNASLQDGTVRADDQEGVEVAVQCIGAAFDVDPTKDHSLAVPTTLPSIFASHLSSAPPASAPPPSTSRKQTTAEDTAQAEKHKAAGNAHMSGKRYQAAIDAYTEAIKLAPSNPVYYSNRAAAYSSMGDHEEAVSDAEKALEVDPNFVKAYSRLGHAKYSLKDYRGAVTAFERGLTLDAGNANLKLGLENAQARVSEQPEEDVEEIDPRQEAATTGAGGGGAGGFDFARAAEMLGGGGAGRGAGGGAGGGMPDIASMLNNPQLMQMAQNMMANGGLEQLMNNPALRNMAQQFMGGAGRGA